MADSQPETGYLDRLCAELRVRGLPSEVITSSYKPRLRIDSPYAYGDFAGAEFDNVFAAAPDGHWSYWWPWVEEICAADDPVKAAEVIITGLGLDDSDGDDEDEDEDEDEAPAHGTGDNTAPGHGGVADTITTHPDDGIAKGHGHCGQSAPAHSGYRNR